MSAEFAPIRVVVIPPEQDLPVEVRSVDPRSFSDLVGGQTEIVTLDEEVQAVVWCNAYGIRLGLPANSRATRFVDAYRPGYARFDTILGAAFVCGFDEEGQPANVPADLEAAARSIA